MRTSGAPRLGRLWVRVVPSRLFMMGALAAVKVLFFLGFHGWLAAGFGGAQAPVWRLYRRLYGGRS